MHLASRLTVLVLVAALSGCAGPADSRTAPAKASPSVEAGEETSPDSDAEGGLASPRRALTQALQPILHERTTWFRATITLAGEPLMVTEGVADAAATWKARTRFTFSTGERRVMLTRAAQGTVWMQMQDWTGSSEGCWLAMSPTQVPLGVVALSPDEPQFISVLGDLEGVAWRDYQKGTIAAELSMQGVLRLLTTQLANDLDLTKAQFEEPVLAIVEPRDGRIAAVRISGFDVLTSLDKAGVTVSDEAHSFLTSAHIEVEFPERRGRAQVSAPAPRLRIQADEGGCR